MSTLYRCKARVAYKPFNTDKVITFEERQIADLNVKLKWEPNLATANDQKLGYTGALNRSTCQVTINDPYFQGVTWPAVYDMAQLYFGNSAQMANGVLLPSCGEGEDPSSGKCYKYVDIETGNTRPNTNLTDSTSVGLIGNYAHLIIGLWYDVGGVNFGTDFYFRVSSFSISHGNDYPQVVISGVEPASIIFNQTPVNRTIPEGTTVDEALRKIFEESGYSVSFCNTGDKDPYVIPRAQRWKGLTDYETAIRQVKAVNGNMLMLPHKEYANKVSICTRGDVNQGCSVFYLGKGLYEQYKIDGAPDVSLFARNAEMTAASNDDSAYTSETFQADEYQIDNITPEKTKKALEDVDKKAFPEQFKIVEKRLTGSSTSGRYWAEYTAQGKFGVVTEKKDKDINLYGIFSGSDAISFLDGVVKSSNKESGEVLIRTAYFIKACKNVDEDNKKCFSRPIYQETRNLEEVSVKANDTVTISQPIGSSTEEEPEFTRFFIRTASNEITLAPSIVYNFATPEGELEDKKKPDSKPEEDNNVNEGDAFVGRIGSTGSSTGPHLHAMWRPDRTITAEQVLKYVKIGGGYSVTSPYGAQESFRTKPHEGIDFGAAKGTPLYLQNGASVIDAQVGCVEGDSGCGSGYGNNVLISTPEGDMLLAHLQESSVPSNIEGVKSTGSSLTKSNVSAAPAVKGINIETEFKGVPRVLRAIPGRTILSFVTNYDEWVKSNRSTSIDPGVWIPEDFRSWFMTGVNYQWEKGDLRVKINGVSGWGARPLDIPKFSEYLIGMETVVQGQAMSDYYDYIRSPGDLCYDINGENSCKKLCSEAQALERALRSTGGRQGSSERRYEGSAGGATGFPTAGCTYTGSQYPQERVQKIINAAYSLGIKTNIGLAAVVGNALQESGPQLDPTILGDNNESIGIFQWNKGAGRYQKLENYANSVGGSMTNIDVQMGWFVKEAREFYPGLASAVSNAATLGDATLQFERIYEGASDPRLENRIAYANDILNGMKCDR